MRITIGLLIVLSFSNALAELSVSRSSQRSYTRQIELSEKEHRCLSARKSLEEIFSEEADHLNQPFVEIRDAIQAYKKLDCVYTSGFLFSDQRQVDKYFRYKARAALRAPASLE
ncbi:MAG: hypothetical protein ACRBBP_06740 [Bdellovibrionales bacterium]